MTWETQLNNNIHFTFSNVINCNNKVFNFKLMWLECEYSMNLKLTIFFDINSLALGSIGQFIFRLSNWMTFSVLLFAFQLWINYKLAEINWRHQSKRWFCTFKLLSIQAPLFLCFFVFLGKELQENYELCKKLAIVLKEKKIILLTKKKKLSTNIKCW